MPPQLAMMLLDSSLALPPSILIGGLFIAVAAGWALGRYSLRRSISFRVAGPPMDGTGAQDATASRTLSEEYFRGLRFLLDEEPDKALAVFLRMVDVDNETVETHFALGSLYRRRGQIDRAIRVHENVMARPALSEEHRVHAMFALAEDYFSAGLFDRAERLFLQLSEGGSCHIAALRYLLRLYEQQRDWDHAIEIHRRLADVATPEHPTAIAHYYCELAEQAREGGRFDDARAFLRQAREAQRNFPRSALIRADIALDMHEPQLAAMLCRRVVELHPRLLALALPRVVRAIRAGADELERCLQERIQSEPLVRAELAYAAIFAGLQEEALVRDCLPDLLREDPSLGEIVHALVGEPGRLSVAQRRALADALGRILRRTQRYRCVECGFASTSHFWQCPGCRSWDAFAPVVLLDLTPGVQRR